MRMFPGSSAVLLPFPVLFSAEAGGVVTPQFPLPSHAFRNDKSLCIWPSPTGHGVKTQSGSNTDDSSDTEIVSRSPGKPAQREIPPLKRRRSTSSDESAFTSPAGCGAPPAGVRLGSTHRMHEPIIKGAACISALSDAGRDLTAATPSDGLDEDVANPDRMCAEVLQLLRAGSWEDPDRRVLEESRHIPKPASRHLGKSASTRVGGPRRKYTWRSLHHRCFDTKGSEDSDGSPEAASAQCFASCGDSNPSGSSGSSHREQDKEWAALTTWLRMNLHQVYTASLPSGLTHLYQHQRLTTCCNPPVVCECCSRGQTSAKSCLLPTALLLGNRKFPTMH